ncbi:uncharacterized protein EV422DRAFT_519300 [Fimicolochytrium jonesii]|uniref:uncharacterized protein n=1 Tax=Fimicolochytrium jonesii TaxID=1396493 RepID=UPI0022FF095A|nr:uncharacterized protein EV422DRAFT_519300 [Fimicolochytrium jonesii]KAI8824215.1 hypothetical protein EV422DRAFT_519300 [Fimicolochytrium jonesii]
MLATAENGVERSKDAPYNGKTFLVTGANSGVGYGIVQRLLEQALEPNSEDVVIVMACRSRPKAEAARQKLLEESQTVADAKVSQRRRSVKPEMLQILIVDLASMQSVFAACEEFQRRFSRLDALLLNAGILPCSHINIRRGVKNLLTRPSYVAKTGGDFFSQYLGDVTADGLGTVFAANVFGHYVMVKQLLSTLSRSPSSRVLWFSSTTADPSFFNPADFQCLKGDHPYESSKRLCELLAVQMHSELRDRGIYSYVVSPGNCFTGLLDQGWFISFAWLTVLYLMRLMYISGCNVTPKNGATSAVHLASEVRDPSDLKESILYHSEISPLGHKSVRHLPLEVAADDLTGMKTVRKELDVMYQRFREEALRNGIIKS